MLMQVVCTDQSLIKGPGHLAVRESYSVGRSSRCAFVLSDPSVSRRHAELIPDEHVVLVKDLKSRNGTFVDGVKIATAEVKVGQVIRFGNATFQLLANERPEDINSAVSTLVIAAEHKDKPGFARLSGAQRRVLDLLLMGLGEKEVAARLKISPHTVHNHIRAIYRKMGVNSRPELLARFVSELNKKEPRAK